MRQQWGEQPVAFCISVLTGAVGAVLIVIGLIVSVDGVLYAGLALGTASLVAALAWRSELIKAWKTNPARQPLREGGRQRRR